MKKKIFKVLAVVTLLTMLLSSINFAGSWTKAPFNSGSTKKVMQFDTPIINKTSGMPGISFWVSAEPSVREVKVELMKKDYNSQKGVWEYKAIQSTSRRFNYKQTGYMDMNYTKSYLQEEDIYYRITVTDGTACQFDGSVNYYKL